MVSRAFLTFNPKLQQQNSLYQTTNAGEVSDVDVVEKMPLQNEWTIWEQLENDSHKDYTSNMKPVLTFSTVQEFWRIWDNLPQPSQLMTDHRMISKAQDGPPQMVDAMMIFRDNVKPMWEDPLNANGGHFEARYQLTKDEDSQARIDEHWNNIVLGIIGATVDPVNVITGVRLVDKLRTSRGGGFLRIEIWFTDTGNPDARKQLKESIEATMSTRPDGTRDMLNVQLSLKPHQKGGK